MLKNIGLFCKKVLQKRPVFCKETCIFKHPTHRSHPIAATGHSVRHIRRCATCQILDKSARDEISRVKWLWSWLLRNITSNQRCAMWVTSSNVHSNLSGRLVGSLKLHVSFAEYSLFFRAFLQKRPMILRNLVHSNSMKRRCDFWEMFGNISPDSLASHPFFRWTAWLQIRNCGTIVKSWKVAHDDIHGIKWR